MVSPTTARLLAALNPLLEQALSLSAPEYEEWLGRLRRTDPGMARELEALLAKEEELDTGGFLQRADWSAEPPAELAGRRLGAYTLERPIGQGGMGTVWLARRSDGRFEGLVAVKLLSLALLDPVGAERFRREGTMLARLSHPNIARLLDAGVGEDGQPYLVLEYVDGSRIDVYADRRGLGPRERLALFRDVLSAVGHAHANLIVHRDLKPSNILVSADGTVKLLDFGIAKLLDQELTGERTALTRRGGQAMTPEYAAPEQVKGEPITTATDVYALGVLLYVLLSGRHPTGAGVRTPADAIRALVEVEPGRLGLGDLDTVLGKALRKDPAERYQTVAMLDDDIARYLRQEPVSARPHSLSYRSAKFLRRHRGAVALGTMVAALLVGTTAFSVAQMREARRQRDLAVLQGKRADAQIQFQELLMSQVGDEPLTMRQILDRSRGALERQYAGDSAFFGSLLVQLARRYAELGLADQRDQLLQRAESLAAASEAGVELAEVRCELADALRTRGEYDQAWAVMEGVDSLFRRHRDADRAEEIACLTRRSHLAEETGRGEESEAAIRRAIAIKDSLGQTDDRGYVDLLQVLVGALGAQRRYRDALAEAERADRAMERMGEGETVARLTGRHNMAVILRELGRTAEAERVLHRVLRVVAQSDSSGWIHWQPLIHYAEAAMAQGLADSAAAYFELLVRQAVADSNPYWEGRGTFGLARAQIGLGRLDEARRTIARFRRVMEAYSGNKGTDDHFLDVRSLDGMLALRKGDTAAAHASFMEVLRDHRFFEGKRPKHLRMTAVLAAESALPLGDPATALELAREVIQGAAVDSLAHTTSFWVGEGRLIEGRALLARGDTTAGRRALEQALAALRAGGGPSHPRFREAERRLAALEGPGAAT
jgi:eukaryotic-like serine/threonine-protein kinase